MQGPREQETFEYRWMAAAAAAFACCAIGLVATTIMLTTGDRYEFRPPPSEIARLDDELVRSFDALESMAAKRAASVPQTTGFSASGARSESSTGAESPKASRKRRMVVRLKSPWCTGALRNQPFHRCRTQSW
jgi:hypothetical protein